MPKPGWWLADFCDDVGLIKEQTIIPEDHQGYLAGERLYCLFEGCDWEGKSLSNHVVQTHEVDLRAFKMATGFNLGDGLVCRTTRKKQQDNPNTHRMMLGLVARPDMTKVKKNYEYKSVKVRRKLSERIKPGRAATCQVCGKEYTVHNSVSRGYFCTSTCRTKHYYYEKYASDTEYSCGLCGTMFKPTSGQTYRGRDKGKPVYCSLVCRQTANARQKRGSKFTLTNPDIHRLKY